jgi:hypothetical protein
MRKRMMSLMGLSLIFGLASTSSFGQGAGSQGAAEVQVLPNGNVMIVNLEGTLEFCLNEQDRGCADNSGNPPDRKCSCRILQNSCDFIVANKETGEISEPQPISVEAVDLYGGQGAFPIIKEKSTDLLDKFKFGENECNMMAAAAVPGGEDTPPPFTPPGCTHCEEPTSPQ